MSGVFVTAAAMTPAWAIELELENKADLAAVGAVKKVADGKAARDKQLGVLSPGDNTPLPPPQPATTTKLAPAPQKYATPDTPPARQTPLPAPKHDTRATIAKAAGATPQPAPALALPGSGQAVMRYCQETTPIANIVPSCNARLAQLSESWHEIMLGN